MTTNDQSQTPAVETPAQPAAESPAPAAEPTPAATPGTFLARVQKTEKAARVREGAEAWVFSFRDQVAELLAGRVRDVDGYLYNVFRTIAAVQPLRESTRDSLAGAILLGATLGFEIGGPLGHYYLTPRFNKNAVKIVEGRERRGSFECVPVIGYRGFFELGYRSGNVSAFEYVRVREGDHFETGSDSARGNWYEFKALRGGDNKRPLTDVVAIAKLTNGQTSTLAMTVEEILSRRPTSWEKTPWGNAKFADAMATKTPFREQAKFLRLSTDLALAVNADEMVSLWNRETEAIDTRRDEDGDDTAETVTTGEDARTIDESDGNTPPAGDVEPSATQTAAGSTNAPETPRAAQSVSGPPDTSKIDALDLPAHVREQGREMTPAEYERYSAAGGE